MPFINSWWRKVFEGDLAIGLSEQKLEQLEDESFIFYQEGSPILTNPEMLQSISTVIPLDKR